MTFYLKYRPQILEELDLENVRDSLKTIVKSGNIPHAFLFSGPKGIGKTSAARILAKIVNCAKLDKSVEPCNRCESCIAISKGSSVDVIELDAASHRGIDDVRSLRDNVKLAPAHSKKKVYIIDEAHMLTTEAANALLKTLEEPPEHVMFILATTNPEKLIETIRSRVVDINFKKASEKEIIRSLKRVIKGEKIKSDEDSLYLITKASGGSYRDAHKLLEQIVTQKKKVTKKTVEEFLFYKNIFDPDDFIRILSDKSAKIGIEEIEKLSSSGVSMKNVSERIIEKLREILMSKIGLGNEDKSKLEKNEVIYLIKLFNRAYFEIPSSFLEQIPLELAVIEWCEAEENHSEDGGKKVDVDKKKLGNKKRENEENNSSPNDDGSISLDNKADLHGESNNVLVVDKVFNKVISNGIDEAVWSRILHEIRPKNASTEALLRAAKPIDYDGKNLTLGVYYKFHKEKLETAPHRDILENVLSLVTGSHVRVYCTLSDPPARKTSESSLRGTSGGNGENQHEGISNSQDDSIAGENASVLAEPEDEEIVKIAEEIFGS